MRRRNWPWALAALLLLIGVSRDGSGRAGLPIREASPRAPWSCAPQQLSGATF